MKIPYPFSLIHPTVIEFAITDFCNLACPNCSQATPVQKSRESIPLEKFIEYLKIIAPSKPHTIKISGGEPTLHKNFVDIIQAIYSFMPECRIVVATNAAMLLKKSPAIEMIDLIDVAHYPGENDQEVIALKSEQFPNVRITSKRDGIEMMDVNKVVPNQSQFNCVTTRVRKVVGNRIYPCCISHGIAIRAGIDTKTVSTPVTKGWDERIDKIDMSECCKRCWMENRFSMLGTIKGILKDPTLISKIKNRIGL